MSLLPFPLLYLLSDGLFLVLYHVVGYRKRLVLQNLGRSFPEKSDAEVRELARKFYKHLCDLVVEVFKTLTISPAAMLRHCYFEPESKKLLNDLAAEGKSVILVMGHQGNWEWAGNTFSLEVGSQLYVVYHPLAHPHFDRLIYNMRTRFGTRLIAMKDTFKEMLAQKAEVSTTAFIADQTPSSVNAHWMRFLNQDTPVFLGTERIARKLGYPVVYAFVKKVKRGHYQIHVEMLVEDPKSTADGQITTMHTRRLEEDIRQQPETWLWSHRRWKRSRPASAS